MYRKSNRLKNYDYSTPGAYFVTVCVKDRKKLLGDIVGGDAFIATKMELSTAGEIVKKYIMSIDNTENVTVDKYVIMPNHIHLLLSIHIPTGTMWASSPTTSISQILKSFKILVTKEIGTSIFQRSYHDHIIRGEKDYQAIWEYINGNPLKWKEDRFYVE